MFEHDLSGSRELRCLAMYELFMVPMVVSVSLVASHVLRGFDPTEKGIAMLSHAAAVTVSYFCSAQVCRTV